MHYPQISGQLSAIWSKVLAVSYTHLVPSFTTHSYQCNSHFTHYYLHIYEDHQSESGILEDWIEMPAWHRFRFARPAPLESACRGLLISISPTLEYRAVT